MNSGKQIFGKVVLYYNKVLPLLSTESFESRNEKFSCLVMDTVYLVNTQFRQ